ncbi:MAG: Re/Si-specific NAD(P)(+) transhydrogenase subunit alpha [Solirubrobacteraceae bacterium]
MRIGIPQEAQTGETRVAATPNTVEQLVKLGYEVVVEAGAGARSSFTDEAYRAAGASIGDPFGAEVVLAVNAPESAQLDRLAPHATLISWLSPMLDQELVEDLARRPITALALDAVPRISRAQSMDVLSSMANIAGYRAVVEAANEFGRFFTGQVTAAGKVAPAKVLVAGAGVAGLAAIGAAGSLGAIVYATDPRPEVADQVRSLGGQYLAVDTGEQEQASATGYAREMGQDYTKLAEELYARTVPDIDILITTALIPGRPAPRLITAEMVASMRPGSVIVDMAAANGGNVAGTVKGERAVTVNGVRILGYTDLPGRLPTQASQLYGQNLVNLMKLLTPEKDGALVLDFDDVVQRSICVVRDGELTWPPPPVQVSAAPAPGGAGSAPEAAARAPEKPPMPASHKYAYTGLAALLFFILVAISPAALIPHLFVFALAIVIGYYVIGNVHHALHTPLLSVTNAISGIILVGGILEVGRYSTLVTIISACGILLASINIFGGFFVTRRMLSMFTRS